MDYIGVREEGRFPWLKVTKQKVTKKKHRTIKHDSIESLSSAISRNEAVVGSNKPRSFAVSVTLLSFIFSVAVMLIAPRTSLSQLAPFGPKGDIADPRFSLDWSQFRSDTPGLTRLEVYYKIANTGLSFLPHEKGFVARYKLTVRVFRDNQQVGYETFKREKIVNSRARTKMYSDFVLNLVDFDLQSGKYRVVVNLEDRSNERTAKKEINVKLSNFSRSKHPKISGLEFLYSSKPAKESDRFFRKGDIVAVPLVDRGLQGGADGGPVLYYFEIYQGADSALNVIVDTKIKHQTKGLVYHDSIHVMLDRPQSKELRRINLRDFSPGSYEIEVAVYTSEKKMKRKKPSFTRENAFSVNWSLEGRVRHDYETVFRQLELIATAEERRTLKDAKTPEERIFAWTAFWKDRDPTPETKENESLQVFYARVRYADAHFSTPHRLGWKSDRGGVFLKQGRPDEVNDQPVSASVGAYQIWFYYNAAGEPLRFVFFDEYGDEDFRLQYPYDGRRR